MRQALLVAIQENRLDAPRDVLHRWRVTAEVLDDPLRRSILLSPFNSDDFVEENRSGTGRGAFPASPLALFSRPNRQVGPVPAAVAISHLWPVRFSSQDAIHSLANCSATSLD